MDEQLSFHKLRAHSESLLMVEMVAPIAFSFRGPQAQKAAEQVILAAESVPANIAEGYGKGYCPDQLRYLKIALSSACEVESRLRAAVAARRIAPSIELQTAIRQIRRVQSLIQGYMRYVQRKIDGQSANGQMLPALLLLARLSLFELPPLLALLS